MKLTFFLLLAAPLLAEVQLDPTLHLNGVIGKTTASSFQDIGAHAHDPNNHVALQGLDIGLNLRVDDWLSGFINAHVFTDSHHDLDAELEEAFLKLQNLPGGFELRGGRFLNRLGLQNNIHLHGWDFVNANLMTSQFLGEEGLTTEGLELTWLRKFDQSFLALTASYGQAAEHDEHDDPAMPHDHKSEGAYFTDQLTTARALLGYNHTDFHQHRLGLNGAWGDNGFTRSTDLYSLDYTYTWRENGIESGGHELSLGLELAHRKISWEHPDNTAHQGRTSQSSLAAFARYRFAQNWTTALRYEHLQGRAAGPEIHLDQIDYAFQADERDRLSLSLTRAFDLGDYSTLLRLQYSHDELPTESADSIFLQFELNFGDGEVR